MYIINKLYGGFIKIITEKEKFKNIGNFIKFVKSPQPV